MNVEKAVLGDKKEYIAVDFFRFFCALLVVALHLHPFWQINYEFGFWLKEIFCRIAVPFFFVTSGYFLGEKIKDKKQTGRYLRRLLMLYILYTIVYLPFIIYGYRLVGGTVFQKILRFFRHFVCIGSYVHLWYFVGLIVAVALIFILLNWCHLKPGKVLLITAVLYVLGVLGSSYMEFFWNIPIVNRIVSPYYRIFETTRNGFFFGAFPVMAGCYMRLNAGKIVKRKYIVPAILCFGLMHLEVYFLKNRVIVGDYNYTFFTAATAIFLFLTIAFVKTSTGYGKHGKVLRSMSVLIFGVHLFVNGCVEKLGIMLGLPVNAVLQFCLVVVLTICIAGIVVFLSRYKAFAWVKYFY